MLGFDAPPFIGGGAIAFAVIAAVIVDPAERSVWKTIVLLLVAPLLTVENNDVGGDDDDNDDDDDDDELLTFFDEFCDSFSFAFVFVVVLVDLLRCIPFRDSSRMETASDYG